MTPLTVAPRCCQEERFAVRRHPVAVLSNARLVPMERRTAFVRWKDRQDHAGTKERTGGGVVFCVMQL